MKTKFNLLITALVVAGTCLLNSCAKDGETGPAGATGAAGTNGTNGNANVKTYNYTINQSDWIQQTPSILFSPSLPCAGITQAIIDSGMVLVYWDANNLGAPNPHNYVQFPVIGWNSVADRIMASSWQLSPTGGGTVTVSVANLGGAAVAASSQAATTLIRVVVASAHMRMANPNLNWNNYNEVKAALHLQD